MLENNLVQVNECFGGQFGINCPGAFLKILKLREGNEGDLKSLKNHPNQIRGYRNTSY